MNSKIKDLNFLFFKYYHDNPELRRIVMNHSELVAKKALHIAKEKKLRLDPKDIYCAAMLHDIGVVKCKAPGIHAHGELPYIQHGIVGKKMLEENGLKKYASVCEVHTGAGLTADEIKSKHLELPVKNYLPHSMLEKLICYADKFYSKSHDLDKEKSIESIIKQMKNYGEDSLARFMELHNLFHIS